MRTGPNRWKEIQELYFLAEELPPEERAAFLDQRCGDDAELRREVASLLAADDTGDPLLDADFEELVRLVAPEAERASGVAAPERAGPYRILEEIGRGGMGSVYRAERDDDQYRRTVALKLVRLDVNTPDVQRRFRQERQILAVLEHKNVARLYDAGVTEDGQPYLAMELVHGEPIHRYCDSRRLTVPERLRLFEQVVAGVDYLHRNLVIHRDLKPSNILVTEEGEVKILDFGIAKLLSDDTASETGVRTRGTVAAGGPAEELLTRIDQRILTPEYASPEQLEGRPLTTASDVYALGVLLHQLLTGHRPTINPTTREVVAPPSASTTRPGASASPGSAPRSPDEIAHHRGTTPNRLRRALHGELDTLLLKALRTDREERYPFAAALLEDLVRFREGRALTARAPSLGYRTRKLVGRNRMAVGAAAAAVAGLVIGLGAALQQAEVARQERDVAVAVSGFMENLFTTSNPFMAGSERRDTLRIGVFLDRAVEQLDRELGDQPEVRARMQASLAAVYHNLGRMGEAKALTDASLESYRTLPGDRDAELASVLRTLGRVALNSGEPLQALDAYERALELAIPEHGERSLEVADLRFELSGILMNLNRIDEAESALSAALEVREAQMAGSPQLADNLNLLGSLQYRQGRVEEALETMGRGLEMSREMRGPDHPGTAVFSMNLGFVSLRIGRIGQADTLLQAGIAGVRAAIGPDYPALGMGMKMLATVRMRQERWEEADSLFQAAIAFTTRVLGEENDDMTSALHDYAGFLFERERQDEALRTIGRALELERRVSGPESGQVGVITSTMADMTRRTGDLAEAEALFQESLTILRAAFPADHPRILHAEGGLGRTLQDQGRMEEAGAILHDVWERTRSLTDGGVRARSAARNLASYYEALGDEDEAGRWRELGEDEPQRDAEPGGWGSA